MKKWTSAVLAIAVLAGAGSPGMAAPLAPGGAVFPADVFSLSSGSVGDPLIGMTGSFGSLTLAKVDSMSAPYITVFGEYAGTLHSMVYADTGSGHLTFLYRLDVDSSPAISRPDDLVVKGYKGWATNVGRLDDGSLVNWDFFNRDPAGNSISGQFITGLANGASSEWMVVHTNATTYHVNLALVQNGDQAATSAFAPAPLPSSIVLFGTGVLGLMGGAVRRWRRAGLPG